MFHSLFKIHKTVDPTVFTELLIGLSPVALTPPEDNVQSRVLLPAGLYGEVRNATTEMIYGVGLEAEFVGINCA